MLSKLITDISKGFLFTLFGVKDITTVDGYLYNNDSLKGYKTSNTLL